MILGFEIYVNDMWVDISPSLLAEDIKITERLMSSSGYSAMNTCGVQLLDQDYPALNGSLLKFIWKNNMIRTRLYDDSKKTSDFDVTGFQYYHLNFLLDDNRGRLRVDSGQYRDYYTQQVHAVSGAEFEVTLERFNYLYINRQRQLVLGDRMSVNLADVEYELMLFDTEEYTQTVPSHYKMTNITLYYTPSSYWESPRTIVFGGIVRPIENIKINHNNPIKFPIVIADWLYYLKRNSPKEILIARGWTNSNINTIDEYLEYIFNSSNGFFNDTVHFKKGDGQSIRAESLLIEKGKDIKKVLDEYLFQYGLVLFATPSGHLTTRNILRSSNASSRIVSEAEQFTDFSIEQKELKYGKIEAKYGKLIQERKDVFAGVVNPGSVAAIDDGYGNRIYTGFVVPYKKDNGELLNELDDIQIQIYLRITSIPVLFFSVVNDVPTWTLESKPVSSTALVPIVNMYDSQSKWNIWITKSISRNSGNDPREWQREQQYHGFSAPYNRHIVVRQKTPIYYGKSASSLPGDSWIEWDFAMTGFNLSNGKLSVMLSSNIRGMGPHTSVGYSYGIIYIFATYSSRNTEIYTLEIPEGNPSEIKKLTLYNRNDTALIQNILDFHYVNQSNINYTSLSDDDIGAVLTVNNSFLDNPKILVQEKSTKIQKIKKNIIDYKTKLL